MRARPDRCRAGIQSAGSGRLGAHCALVQGGTACVVSAQTLRGDTPLLGECFLWCGDPPVCMRNCSRSLGRKRKYDEASIRHHSFSHAVAYCGTAVPVSGDCYTVDIRRPCNLLVRSRGPRKQNFPYAEIQNNENRYPCRCNSPHVESRCVPDLAGRISAAEQVWMSFRNFGAFWLVI